jgi:hypothetical protein
MIMLLVVERLPDHGARATGARETSATTPKVGRSIATRSNTDLLSGHESGEKLVNGVGCAYGITRIGPDHIDDTAFDEFSCPGSHLRIETKPYYSCCNE